MEDKVKKSVNTQVLLQKVALTSVTFISDILMIPFALLVDVASTIWGLYHQ